MAEHTNLPDRPISGVVVTAQGSADNGGLGGELAHLIPAARAALLLVADAIRRGGADQADVVEAVKNAGLADAFAGIFDAAADAAWDEHIAVGGDEYDFDARLHCDNLTAVGSDIRDAISPYI
ncbi:hypothetical protein ACFWXO_36845 [Kitasatospora sp. NPDC059088]|uniref:hypothetical protein n=1 Tax=Kitasatospora sp. NPDC059088 TaxID=3346722 RepID=UPI003675CCCF